MAHHATISLALLLCLLGLASACPCSTTPSLFNETACSSSSLALGVVVNRTESCKSPACIPSSNQTVDTVFYAVSLVNQFKGPSLGPNGTTFYMQTKLNRTACGGVQLVTNKTYLFDLSMESFAIAPPTLSYIFTRCAVPKEWKTLSNNDKELVTSGLELCPDYEATDEDEIY